MEENEVVLGDPAEAVSEGRQDSEYSGEETWIPKEDLCRKCGKRRVDRSENRNSILCHECREEQIRYPFPKKMLPAVVLILVLMALAMVRTPTVLKCYKSYTESLSQANAGDIYPALLGLQSVLDEYPESVPVAERMIDLAMSHGYYDTAAYVMNDYMEGKSVSDSTYSRLTGYANRLNRYYETTDKIIELFSSITEDMSEEEAAGMLEQVKAEMLALTKDSAYDEALLYYYLGGVTEDQDQALEYLKSSVEADNSLAVAQVALGTNLRRRGDLGGAEEVYETVLRQDRNDTGALRAMGILKMLKGDKEAGLFDIQEAYDLNPEESYVKETLIIALTECGKTEEAAQRKQQFEDEGTVFDGELETYLSGSVDLYGYYVDPQQ